MTWERDHSQHEQLTAVAGREYKNLSSCQGTALCVADTGPSSPWGLPNKKEQSVR